MNEALIEIIRSVTENEEIEITEDTELVDDLELSSLEFFSLVTQIENRFRIKISDREVQELETVGDIVELIGC